MCASFPCFELTTDLTHLARGKEFRRLPRFRRLPWPAQARPAADGVVAMVSETLAACADLPENPRQGNRLLLRPAIATSARHEDQQVVSGRLPVARCVQDAPLTAPGDRQTQVLQPQVLKLKEENLRLGGAWRWLQQHRQDHQHIQPQHQHDPRLLQALQDFQAAIQRLKHLLLLPDFPVRVHPDAEDQPPQIPQQAPLQQPAPTPQPSPQTPTRSHSDAGQEGRAWWSSLLGPAPGQEQASESVPQLQEVQAVLLQATRHVLGRMLLLPPGLTLR